eukprot:COSAG04_NODE_544_length_12827_cov_262.923421_12_plen_140_part_00
MSGVPKRWGQHGGVGSLARRIPFVTKEGSVQRLWLCRHGQTAANQHHLIQGSGIDLPLNTVGQQQALKLGEALASFRFDVIASSDLIRAKASPVSSLSHPPPHLLISAAARAIAGDGDGAGVIPPPRPTTGCSTRASGR